MGNAHAPASSLWYSVTGLDAVWEWKHVGLDVSVYGMKMFHGKHLLVEQAEAW